MRKNRVLLIVFCIMLITGSPVYAADPMSEDSNVIPASFDLRNVDTDGDGVGDRCYVTPVRLQYPFGSCWAFAAIAAAEISLLGSVYDYDPEAGIDGYEAQYRLKGTAEWTSVPFEAGENNVSVNGLTSGEYEVHVRAFVDNTKAPVPDSYRRIEYGIFNDISIVDVSVDGSH